MSAVGELAAGIAHEIRNPLSAISMTIQRLGREYKPAEEDRELHKLFGILYKEIAHIRNSIDNLLQFSKPAPLQKSRSRIDRIITKIYRLYETKASKQNISLVWQNREPLEAIVDPTKIGECLINILENALTATPPNGTLTLDAKQKKNTLIITVCDTGKGIPEENISKIFNLYFTTKANGTGLGLAHAHQIVSEHGGEINVKSVVNKGTCFTIKLPNRKEK